MLQVTSYKSLAVSRQSSAYIFIVALILLVGCSPTPAAPTATPAPPTVAPITKNADWKPVEQDFNGDDGGSTAGMLHDGQ